eukprot:1161153-Pelagomonas_calceolata.AAC.4
MVRGGGLERKEFCIHLSVLFWPAHAPRILDLVRVYAALYAQGAVGITAVHACGALTDVCLDVAVMLEAPIAVMPCCYRCGA